MGDPLVNVGGAASRGWSGRGVVNVSDAPDDPQHDHPGRVNRAPLPRLDAGGRRRLITRHGRTCVRSLGAS